MAAHTKCWCSTTHAAQKWLRLMTFQPRTLPQCRPLHSAEHATQPSATPDSNRQHLKSTPNAPPCAAVQRALPCRQTTGPTIWCAQTQVPAYLSCILQQHLLINPLVAACFTCTKHTHITHPPAGCSGRGVCLFTAVSSAAGLLALPGRPAGPLMRCRPRLPSVR